MARSPRRDDEDVLDPFEAADEVVDEEEDLDGFSDVDAEDPDLDEDDLDEDAVAFEEDDEGDLAETDLAESDPDGDETLPALLEDDEIAVVVAETDEDDDEEDALREGEFVCRSCFMAKRESALADPEAMLCRDCA